jgi:hypothetical protein
LFRSADTEIAQMIVECSQQLQDESVLKAALGETTNRTSIFNGTGDRLGTIMEVEDKFSLIDAGSPGLRYVQSQDSFAGSGSYSSSAGYGYSYDYAHSAEASRDAFYCMSSSSSGIGGKEGNNAGIQAEELVLEPGDIIVDKLHIHYGQKQLNPVDNMRFFPKGADPLTFTAKKVNERFYESLLPRTFEELAVRVFCRNPRKDHIARRAFQKFCDGQHTHAPFPSQSQPAHLPPGSIEGGGDCDDDAFNEHGRDENNNDDDDDDGVNRDGIEQQN